MNSFVAKIFIFLIVILLATGLFSCESNFNEIQKNNFSEFTPVGDADGVDLKYTDSSYITAILISKKMLDFVSTDFAFTEFPKGIDLTLYDKKAKKTFIKSNYAVSYKGTSIIDLQGNVKIISQEGQMLETEQLYYDQKNQWFFTEKPFKFSDPKGVSNGKGIDFSKDFKTINSQSITGEIDAVN